MMMIVLSGRSTSETCGLSHPHPRRWNTPPQALPHPHQSYLFRYRHNPWMIRTKLARPSYYTRVRHPRHHRFLTLSSDDVFQVTFARYRAVGPEQWLQLHPEAGSSWPSWPEAAHSPPFIPILLAHIAPGILMPFCKHAGGHARPYMGHSKVDF